MFFYPIILIIAFSSSILHSSEKKSEPQRFEDLKKQIDLDIQKQVNEFAKQLRLLTKKVRVELGGTYDDCGGLFIKGIKLKKEDVKDVLWNLYKQHASLYKKIIEIEGRVAFVGFCEDDYEFQFAFTLEKIKKQLD